MPAQLLAFNCDRMAVLGKIIAKFAERKIDWTDKIIKAFKKNRRNFCLNLDSSNLWILGFITVKSSQKS
jgi:hypothetical protein